MNETEATDSWFSKRVEGQLKELAGTSRDGSRPAIVFILVFTLIFFYFAAHQECSTGFFTSEFGSLEKLLFYGSLFEWILVGVLEVFGRKNLSRDIDAFS